MFRKQNFNKKLQIYTAAKKFDIIFYDRTKILFPSSLTLILFISV